MTNETMRAEIDRRINMRNVRRLIDDLVRECIEAGSERERTRCAAIARAHGAEDIAGEIER